MIYERFYIFYTKSVQLGVRAFHYENYIRVNKARIIIILITIVTACDFNYKYENVTLNLGTVIRTFQ